IRLSLFELSVRWATPDLSGSRTSARGAFRTISHGRDACLPGFEHFRATTIGSWLCSTAPAHSGQHRCIVERSRTSVGRPEGCPAQYVHARCLTKSYFAKAHRSAFGLDTGIP